MATAFVYNDPNSQMARRRLSMVTLSLFVLIVILTSYSFLNFNTSVNLNTKHNYWRRRPYFNSNNLPTVTSAPRVLNTRMQDTSHLPSRDTVLKTKSIYNGDSLTRYGAHLNFNSRVSCPSNSLMNVKRRISKTNLCPKVFIVGAKKGGTTSLYQYLSKHPDFKGIRLQETKWVGETFYFAQKYGQVSLKSYLEQFPRNKMSGDASVDNLLHCKAPVRILRTCGRNVKIIILLRHPIHRYVSNFMMRVARRDTYAEYTNVSSIHDSVMEDIKLVSKSLKKHNLNYPSRLSEWHRLLCLFGCCRSMLYEGLYYVFVMNWLCNFPKENILFVNSEEMFWNPVLILRQVMDFVGLKPLDIGILNEITSHRYNQGVKPFLSQHYLSSSDRQELLKFYSIFNDGLLELLEWKQLDWS